MERVRKVLINVCWHDRLISLTSSLVNGFSAESVGSSKSDSCLVLSPTVWPTV